MNSYFILFSNCIPVKGAKRSSICDLQNNCIKLIPNLLFEVITLFRKMTIANIKTHYNNELNEGIDKYLDVLERDGYGFWTDDPESFPDLSMEWDSPSIITNAIIDIDENSDYSVQEVCSELSNLGCACLQIRIYWKIDNTYLNQILKSLKQSRVKSIELFLMENNWSLERITELCHAHRRVRHMYVYSALINEIKYLKNLDVHIVYTSELVHPETHCGVVNPDFFAINVKHFTESQSFNSCLNRKISVDRFGNIKNCPSTENSYGRFGERSLTDALGEPLFSKHWAITKDQILVCKDCEFRYVCTDCRAYVNDRNDPYSKPSKCNYDPYSATWIEEHAHDQPG